MLGDADGTVITRLMITPPDSDTVYDIKVGDETLAS